MENCDNLQRTGICAGCRQGSASKAVASPEAPKTSTKASIPLLSGPGLVMNTVLSALTTIIIILALGKLAETHGEGGRLVQPLAVVVVVVVVVAVAVAVVVVVGGWGWRRRRWRWRWRWRLWWWLGLVYAHAHVDV